MIPDLTALKIKADAYDKLRAAPAWGQHSDFTWECHVAKVLQETDEQLRAASLNVLSINERLSQTRMRRLLSTQFVYCPKNQYPRIQHAKGEEMLCSRSYTVVIDKGVDPYEQLIEREAQLFDTEDEMIVFWRGPALWSFQAVPYEDKLWAICEVYVAYRYDNEVWTEPRAIKTAYNIPKIELSPTRIDVSNVVKGRL